MHTSVGCDIIGPACRVCSFIPILFPRLFFIEKGPSTFSRARNLYSQWRKRICALKQLIGNKTENPQILSLRTGGFPSPKFLGHLW